MMSFAVFTPMPIRSEAIERGLPQPPSMLDNAKVNDSDIIGVTFYPNARCTTEREEHKAEYALRPKRVPVHLRPIHRSLSVDGAVFPMPIRAEAVARGLPQPPSMVSKATKINDSEIIGVTFYPNARCTAEREEHKAEYAVRPKRVPFRARPLPSSDTEDESDDECASFLMPIRPEAIERGLPQPPSMLGGASGKVNDSDIIGVTFYPNARCTAEREEHRAEYALRPRRQRALPPLHLRSGFSWSQVDDGVFD
ncbi:hypothetical protein FA15DRAFT_209818 [Coprinopsis marcescibilis]|uniref:Uncharacterized protein n=1 Tax=Coprinopsis marcescibilis TaxID=230819 RepID=A0A5C3L3M8_COPMA|nr:hypothetical protein FA15DRAFT_209818 [Coprinopsis marcescibilis]